MRKSSKIIQVLSFQSKIIFLPISLLPFLCKSSCFKRRKIHLNNCVSFLLFSRPSSLLSLEIGYFLHLQNGAGYQGEEIHSLELLGPVELFGLLELEFLELGLLVVGFSLFHTHYVFPGPPPRFLRGVRNLRGY